MSSLYGFNSQLNRFDKGLGLGFNGTEMRDSAAHGIDMDCRPPVVQRRRTTSPSFDIIFDEFMTLPMSQQKFLANANSKFRFSAMLKDKFTTSNNFEKQADNDDDVLIIGTPIKKFNPLNTTIVVG
ncbi:hypothetical protein PV326_009456 [Microctonus aethiopoides]|nr:hypothetical protein PV326_009456 [Microctonus aethiopoides]